jgi:hypothetical protein
MNTLKLGPETVLNLIQARFSIPPQTRSPIDLPIGREYLAHLFAELGYTTGAEIGVERGLFTETLCKANPQATIYAIDAWRAYSGYREHVSQGKLDGFYNEAKARLRPYNCKIMRRFSVDAMEEFEPESLDWVFIDGNHVFEQVVADVAGWSKRVRRGGIVSGHDYRKDKGPASFHVPFALSGYTEAYKISPWFVLRGDKSASWMWVKS